MRDWDAVAAYALSLPDSAASTSYGQPAIKVRGRMFVSAGHVDGSFHVRSPHEEKAVLIATASGRRRITRPGPACWSATARAIPTACAA